MTSAAQERANRLNATRSTGPRTEAGKEKTKFNATRHGLTSRQPVLRSEDREDYEELRRQFYEDHQPIGKTEETLVDEIAQCWWRLQRARLHETEAMNNTVVINKGFFEGWLAPILRYMTTAERAWHRALTQLRIVQNDRRKNQQSVPPQPQPTEPEKVKAIGSVSQEATEPEEPQPVAVASQPATPVSESLTTNRQPLTTSHEIGSVSQNAPEPSADASTSQTPTPSKLTTDHWPLTTGPIGSVLQDAPEPSANAAAPQTPTRPSELTTDNRQLALRFVHPCRTGH